jgi:hypothetical protein
MGRLVLLALRRYLELSLVADFPVPISGEQGSVGGTVAARSMVAERLRMHAKLAEVRQVKSISESLLAILARRPDAAPFVRFARLVRDGFDNADPETLREVLGARLLAPASDDRLFELLVGFRIVETLEKIGYMAGRLHILPTANVPFARLRKGSSEIELWWQRPIWALDHTIESSGRYHQTLLQAGMRKSSLRPDFVLFQPSPRRHLLIEAKQTSLAGISAERRGITEALAYVHDAELLFADHPEPHALVVAWNATGQPGDAAVMVCDETGVPASIERTLRRWSSNDLAA